MYDLFGGDMELMGKMINPSTISSIYIQRGNGGPDMMYRPIVNQIVINPEYLKVLRLSSCKGCVEWSLIHEIGHAVDYKNRFAGSDYNTFNFVEEIGYNCFLVVICGSAPSGATDNYASSSPVEDFAQTFTYAVFDEMKRLSLYPSLNQVFNRPSDSRLQFFSGFSQH